MNYKGNHIPIIHMGLMADPIFLQQILENPSFCKEHIYLNEGKKQWPVAKQLKGDPATGVHLKALAAIYGLQWHLRAHCLYPIQHASQVFPGGNGEKDQVSDPTPHAYGQDHRGVVKQLPERVI